LKIGKPQRTQRLLNLTTKARRHEDIKKKLDADFADFAEDFVDGITGLSQILIWQGVDGIGAILLASRQGRREN